ncbi:hypothetical protein COEREDRAFT_83775 [Coemansia reversa NRRL 1564]|uniref:Uncharacterized protein n=1 Tax=Coemansia reversa (strain ATCC 12441 / NRRL 1564) TaxID=763665 RepID=A0A2G5B1X5_COERN|nr:hypothetical protein COEREDRAFT_83775 [Coemansia reversa NRRL 1564]|eukprot:PIA13018.1 hypothetical protein COEREDRAFT_83775 [Coemansia reversa NRRL 1564]
MARRSNILISKVCKDVAMRNGESSYDERCDYPSSPNSSNLEYVSIAAEPRTKQNPYIFTLGNSKTLVDRNKYNVDSDYNYPTSTPSLAPSAHPDNPTQAEEVLENARNVLYTENGWNNDDKPITTKAPVGKKLRIFIIIMRILHTIVSALVIGCFIGIEVYMLLEQFHIAAIPLSVCRLILASALIVLVLCDWAFPKSVHRYFPMYNHQHSLKALGLSQMSIAFFAFSDPTIIAISDIRHKNRFAEFLFPIAIGFSSLLMLLGIIYFIVGAIGGVKLRQQILVK